MEGAQEAANRQVPPPTVAANTAAVTRDRARLWGAMGMFQAIAQILAVRLILMLAVIGGFSLGFFALRQQAWLSLCVVLVYNLLVVVPLVWLDQAGRRAS